MNLKFNGACDTCARPLMGAVTCGGTGYAVDDLGRRHCYVCCADHDRAFMRDRNRIMLYLVKRGEQYFVSNWCGSLEFGPVYVRRGHHNIASRRYDTWFHFAKQEWHGVQYGDNTQILHCRKTKAR